MAKDSPVLNTIRRLVDEEHTLRAQQAQHTGDADALHERIQQLDTELDQCWDLLRQRRALRVAGEDPDAAMVRGTNQVTKYLQ
jgi:Protein of unknown function (DUF2630)